MPTYDYRCSHCGHELELFQSIKESPKRKCPECGTLKLKRVIGAGAAIIFKGSGFYQTDYRSASYKQGAEKAEEAEKPKSDSADKKSSKKDSATSSPKSDSPSKNTKSA